MDRLYGLTAEEWRIALRNLGAYWEEKIKEIENYASKTKKMRSQSNGKRQE